MIICEIGQNHCGNMNLAKQLILLGKENGGDLIKFQLYNHKSLYKDHPAIPNVELSKEQAFDLFNYGEKIGIEVFFSVFDIERVKWCEEMGVKRYKIAGTLKDFNVRQAILKTSKPIIQSGQIAEQRVIGGDVSLLYCINEYPTLPERLQFNQVKFGKDFEGFSDHTLNLTASKVAIARGAKIIERHFCINHQTGIDAEWSMTPEELRELSRFEKVVRQCLG